MARPTGFLEIERRDRPYEKPDVRRRGWNEFVKPLPEPETRKQAARCMDCGIPFCHDGCPVNNLIPDWNNLVYRDQWQAALKTLHSTNNFPEFTGRICPAPCEAACTLNIDDNPVTIKTIECAIVDRGWQEGWIEPVLPPRRTGKRVAVVGSGPAGLACAQQLARAGHAVTLFEKSDRIGGLLRYGIPDFKMEKSLIDRRVEQMEAEGVAFRTEVEIGVDLAMASLVEEFDAVAMTGGAEAPRDLEVPGRELDGIHFAMDFLPQQNKRNAGDSEAARRAQRNHHGGRQARRRDRRRRHRIGLHRHLDAPGGGIDHPARNPAEAARTREQGADLARLAAEIAHLVLAGRGLRARLVGVDQAGDPGSARGPRTAESPALECVRVEWVKSPDGRFVMQEVPDSAFYAEGRPRPVGDGVSRAAQARDGRAIRRRARPARQRRREYRRLPHLRPQAVCRRRHAPRPVARRLGDPRRPPMRPRDRRVPDGNEPPAAIIAPKLRRLRHAPAEEGHGLASGKVMSTRPCWGFSGAFAAAISASRCCR